MAKAQTKVSATQTQAKSAILRISINKMPGINPRITKNLKEAGYGTLEALASVHITELCEIPGVEE